MEANGRERGQSRLPKASLGGGARFINLRELCVWDECTRRQRAKRIYVYPQVHAGRPRSDGQ